MSTGHATETGGSHSPRASWAYRPELDGVRTVAVYLVVLYHCGLAAVEGGFIGVDLFFVLSGFLVTSTLLAEGAARGGVSLLRFYARRARRLLPAAVLVIVATCLLQLLVASAPQRAEMVDDARAALLYYANWHFIAESQDYFATAAESPFVHFWSLAIEEQFYVGLPLVLWLVWRRQRRQVETLAVAAGAVAVVSLGLQVWRAQGDATYAYYATDTRVYQLAVGVLLACLFARAAASGAGDPRDTRGGTGLAVAGLAGLLALAGAFDGLSASWRGIGAAGASALLLAGLQLAPRGALARLLSREPVRYLGTISYSTYLWHWPLVLALDAVLDVRPLVLAAGVALLATALAALSDRLLERPVRGSRLLGRRPAPVVAGGLALSAVTALLVVGPVLDDPRRPAVAATDGGGAAFDVAAAAAVLAQPVPEGLDLVAALEDVPWHGDVCTVEDLTACRRTDGGADGLRVLLVGDSQAAMFADAFVALAEQRGWTLFTNVVTGCTWQQGLRNQRSRPEAHAECREARAGFYADVLPRLDVDAVVAISMARAAKRWERLLTADPPRPGETLRERHLRTTRETAEAVTAAGSRLVLVKSILGTGGYDLDGPDPLDCLARARVLGDCAVLPPLQKPPLDGFYETMAAESDLVSVTDLNPLICLTPPVCQPVRGRTVIWKDPDHITGTFAVEQRRRILTRLRRAVPELRW